MTENRPQEPSLEYRNHFYILLHIHLII